MPCPHTPPCPAATALDREAAVAILHDESFQATKLCNGVVVFSDLGELIPLGDTAYATVPSHPGPALHVPPPAEPVQEPGSLVAIGVQIEAMVSLIDAHLAFIQAALQTHAAARDSVVVQGDARRLSDLGWRIATAAVIWNVICTALFLIHL